MKTIGLLGGMSWESTLSYYKLLNEGVKKELGGLHSARIIMLSVDFEEIETLQRKNDWKQLGDILAKEAKSIEDGGADFLIICTNTMHKVIDIIKKSINIPVLHIAEATSLALKKENCKKTILLGTRFTMQEDFIKKVIQEHNIAVVIPNNEQIKKIDDIIFNELVLGKIKKESKQVYIDIINNLCQKNKNIDSVILGCTEIGLLIGKNDIDLKIFDTTEIHVNKALNIALET